MGLFGWMRIHESGIDRGFDTPNTSCTSTMPSSTHTPSPSVSTISSSISETGSDTTNFSSPHRPPAFTSHISLVGHLPIHPTEVGEPVPGAPIYTRSIRLNCPHCTRTFTHRMGLLGHMRIHE
ncbi:hypothetical protein SprV_0902656300 [Sparganum proliferum]